MKKSTRVFDNNGESLDRFTIITENGDVYASSEFPFHSFGCFCFNVKDDLKQKISNYVKEAKKEKFLGSLVEDHSKLPKDVQKFIKQITL